MTKLTYRNGISIGELVVYTPALGIAIFLAIRHGFKKSSGWRFLITFALARILGACFQLATINNLSDENMYIGEWVLLNIALSPLELTALGLLSRVLESINKSHPTHITPRHIKYVELINLVGLILAITGGVQAGNNYADTGVISAPSTTKAALALFIVSYFIILVGTVFALPSISHAEQGEKRVLVAIAVSLPFLLVRLIYSAVAAFSHRKNFNSVFGSATLLLCMALLMEAITVVIYEGVGLTLKKIKPQRQPDDEQAPIGTKWEAPNK